MGNVGYIEKSKTFWNQLGDTIAHFLLQQVDEHN